jgi:TPR repeat protein
MPVGHNGARRNDGMSYVVHVWEPAAGAAPADLEEAMQQLEQAWERLEAPRKKFETLLKRLTRRYPDITSPEAQTLPEDSLAWSDGPLSAGNRPVLVLGLTSAMCDEVQPFLVKEANKLGLHVTDEQAGEIYLASGEQVSVVAARRARFAALRQSAELGNAPSQYELALILRHGAGAVAADPAEAFHWFSLAGKQAYGFALRMQGVMHEKGEGTPRDMQAAARCYRDAIAHGSLAAHASLATLYLDGKGLPRDPAEAQRLYKSGIRAGDANCMSGWALMFNRTGRAEDQVFMLALRMRAAQLNPGLHGSILEVLREHATPAALVQAERLAQEEDIVAAIEVRAGDATA